MIVCVFDHNDHEQTLANDPGNRTVARRRVERASPGSSSRHCRKGRGRSALARGDPVLVFLLWWLYRREGRDLRGRSGRLWSRLRMLTLAALAAMLVEPVLISTRRETVRSHLADVLDDSESMKFSDPYTDDSQGGRDRRDAEARSAGGRSPVDRLRETPRLELVKSVLKPEPGGAGHGRELFIYDLESAAQPRPRRVGPARDARRHQAEPGGLAARRCPSRGAGRRIAGQPVAGRDPGDRRPVQHRRRPAPRRRGGDPPGYSDLPDRRRCRRRAAERPAGRDRGQPGRSSCATR